MYLFSKRLKTWCSDSSAYLRKWKPLWHVITKKPVWEKTRQLRRKKHSQGPGLQPGPGRTSQIWCAEILTGRQLLRCYLAIWNRIKTESLYFRICQDKGRGTGSWEESCMWTSGKISPKQILGLMRNKRILKIRRFACDFVCNRPDFMCELPEKVPPKQN